MTLKCQCSSHFPRAFTAECHCDGFSADFLLILLTWITLLAARWVGTSECADHVDPVLPTMPTTYCRPHFWYQMWCGAHQQTTHILLSWHVLNFGMNNTCLGCEMIISPPPQLHHCVSVYVTSSWYVVISFEWWWPYQFKSEVKRGWLHLTWPVTSESVTTVTWQM
jgi:hypothetical protein